MFALGFALWLAGVESGTDLAERSAPLNKCFNYSSLTPKRPCLLMHAHSRELGSIPGLTYAAALARLDEAGEAVDAAVRLAVCRGAVPSRGRMVSGVLGRFV